MSINMKADSDPPFYMNILEKMIAQYKMAASNDAHERRPGRAGATQLNFQQPFFPPARPGALCAALEAYNISLWREGK
jgi:hypothetical protein